MKKVSFFDGKLMVTYGSRISVVSTGIFLLLIFFDIPETQKSMWFVVSLVLLIVVYIGLWVYSNKKKSVVLKINGVTVTVKEGDIFESPGLKVIPFNEYFDTVVDDALISSNTLNGMYIKGYVKDIKALDSNIANNVRVKEAIIVADTQRKCGKQVRYALGTIHRNGEFLLLAFAKFDKDNRAYLDSRHYRECILNMWNELDVIYAGNSISIPVLGSGMTRPHGMSPSEQDSLERLIISLKFSDVRFRSPAKVNIIVHKPRVGSINFFKLLHLSD